jgi:hypothetical protein
MAAGGGNTLTLTLDVGFAGAFAEPDLPYGGG